MLFTFCVNTSYINIFTWNCKNTNILGNPSWAESGLGATLRGKAGLNIMWLTGLFLSHMNRFGLAFQNPMQ